MTSYFLSYDAISMDENQNRAVSYLHWKRSRSSVHLAWNALWIYWVFDWTHTGIFMMKHHDNLQNFSVLELKVTGTIAELVCFFLHIAWESEENRNQIHIKNEMK